MELANCGGDDGAVGDIECLLGGKAASKYHGLTGGMVFLRK